MTFVSAYEKQPMLIVYKDEAGREWIRQGGSRAWRNFNPGNIQKGSFAESCGAIGGDSRFAIFPDEPTGLNAIVTLFKSSTYRNLSIHDAIFRYAPPNENESGDYANGVAQALGVSPGTVVSSLSDAQLLVVTQAIKKREGWAPGNEYAGGGSATPVMAMAAMAAPAGGSAMAGDKDHIADLLALGGSADSIQRIQDIAAKSMQANGLGYTLHNACAATLSAFLQQAGINIETTLGAGNLAKRLKNRGWRLVDVGDQQAGDVGVAYDRTPPAGADHIYLVVKAVDRDEMVIADNQDRVPHTRFATGRGKTATEYFLRAPGFSVNALLSSLALQAGMDSQHPSFLPDGDEDTSALPEPVPLVAADALAH